MVEISQIKEKYCNKLKVSKIVSKNYEEVLRKLKGKKRQ